MSENSFKALSDSILDIEEYIENGKIRVIPLKKNTKRPQGSDYYNKSYSIESLKRHDGNFGIIAGGNHTTSSISVIDIDGYKTKDDHEDEVKKITQEYIFNCLKDIPNAMCVKTQSGAFHIYLWNKTISDSIHETSKNLHFPSDFPVEELQNKSLAHSIEIFTKDGTKQCVLPSSTILTEDGEEKSYSIISTINKLSDIGEVEDINETVKNTLIKHGFTYHEPTKSGFITLDGEDNLKELNDNEVSKVALLIIPILKLIDGAKHEGALYLGGYFSNNISENSALRICNLIINKVGDLFKDSDAFRHTVLQNYENDCETKGGLPKLLDIIKSYNPDFNSEKFVFELNILCKKVFRHNILSNVEKTNKKKYLSIDYANNKISTYTWNKTNGDVYYSNIHDIMNISPRNIYESYNILDVNASPQLWFTFYRNGMPTKQTIKGNDIESLEKQLAKRPGIVLSPKEFRGVLNNIINEYIKLGKLEIKEEIPVQGIFINPMTGTLCHRDEKGNTTIIKPSREDVMVALNIWKKLKEVYPGDKKKLSHILRYGLICPFSYVLKTMYEWLPLLFIYGASRTAKTTIAGIALSPYTTINEEISIGGGAFDTEYRMGKALSKQGIGLIINEPTDAIDKHNTREIVKVSIESQYCREKQENGEHVKIPAYSNMIFTSNSFIPTNDAFIRRSQYIEFTKNERLNKDDIKKFNTEFNHKNWNNTDFLKLRAIGDYTIWFISENLNVLSKTHKECIDSMLDSLLDYADENKNDWEWIYEEAELMDITTSDNEVVNQFRRMVLNDYKNLTRNTTLYSNDETFKNLFINCVKGNYIDYLHYQKTDDDEYIIVNTSVKNALTEFGELQITCKGLADYMDCDYKTLNYKNKSIKGFKMKYSDFEAFLDVSE